jgi:UDP-glucose:(heptosyl)LPS alpha-1,3-glucosyltransferase
MRVALLARRFDPSGGGTERDLMVTIDCLQASGHSVSVYADEIRGSLPGIQLRRVGSARLPKTLAFIRFAYAAASMARRDGTDLVLSFARVANADVLRSGGSAHASYLRAARRWRGAGGAMAMSAAPYHRAQVIIERRGFASPRLKGAIAVSDFVRRDLIAQFGLAPSVVTTIYNGVDLERFRPDKLETRTRVRKEFGIPEFAAMVTFVGHGFARKGLGFLIDAFAMFKSDRYLLVVGNDRAVGAFRRRADAHGMGSRVIFAGSQPAIERIFNAADALALPSLFEPFGNVALEAMACGIPVLVSSQCGVAEILPQALREFVVERPEDPSELAGKLEAILQRQEELSAAARAAAAEFTWERHGRELNRVLESLK